MDENNLFNDFLDTLKDNEIECSLKVKNLQVAINGNGVVFGVGRVKNDSSIKSLADSTSSVGKIEDKESEKSEKEKILSDIYYGE